MIAGLLLAAPLIPFVLSTATADTLQVDPGDPESFDTIQAAVDDASPGDRIVVEAGTFNESVTVDVPGLAIVGQASSGSNATVIRPPSGNGFNVAENDIRIEDLRVDGGKNGLLLDDTTNVTLTGIAVTGATNNGVHALFSTDVTIDEAEIGSAGANGIRLADTDASTVRNVTIDGGTRGVHVYAGAGLDLSDVTVDTPDEHGIVIEASQRVTLQNATVRSPDIGIWLLSSDDSEVSTPLVEQATTNGVVVEGASNADIVSPEVQDASTNAITVKGSDTVTVTNGLLEGSQRGFHALDTDDITVDGSTVRNSTEHGLVFENVDEGTVDGVSVSGADAGLWMITSTDVEVQNAEVRDARQDLLNATGTPDLRVAASSFVGSQARGIHLFESPGATIQGGEIRETACDVFLRGIADASTSDTTFYSANNASELSTDVDAVPCDVQPVHAGALSDHDCNEEEWHFVITDLKETAAPETIHVKWSDGTSSDLDLVKESGTVGHYETTPGSHLDDTVDEATTSVSTDWSGEFNLSHGPDVCDSEEDGTWQAETVETDENLRDVEQTTAGAYAVGTGGIVAERTVQDGEVVWQTIVAGGASGNGNDLYGSDVSDDGERLWFVGASGEVGEYDVEAGVLDDHSGPDDTGDNFNDVAVTGAADEANVYAATDSGQIFYSFEDGASGTWEYVTPGSGSSIQAIDCHGPKACHAVDTNGKVFATDDGETWEAIGIPDANVNFYGVDSDGSDDVWVAGGNGQVFHFDGAEWTPTDLGDADLAAIEIGAGEGYAVGPGGLVFHYEDGDWHRETTETEENLAGLTLSYAVGASGTAIQAP